MAMTYDEGVVVSTSDNNGILSVAHENGEEFVLPISLLPEKCVDDPHATSTLYCAAPFQMQPAMYPDAWYKGTLALSDALWKIDIANTEATLISNFLSESGREIDVLKIGADSSGKYLYFINKNDDTLWLYDLTL